MTRVAYLLVLVLLKITWRHQTLRVDVSGDWFNELRVRVHVLHLEEGQNVLDLQVVRAVGHGLAFGGQATRSHPVSILFLLETKKAKIIKASEKKAKKNIRKGALTSTLQCRTEARSHSCHLPLGLAT